MSQREYRNYEVFQNNVLVDYWIESQPIKNKGMKSIKKLRKQISKIKIQSDEQNQTDHLVDQLLSLKMT